MLALARKHASSLAPTLLLAPAFACIEDLQNLSDIGASTFAHIKAFISVSESDISTPADTARYVPPPASTTSAESVLQLSRSSTGSQSQQTVDPAPAIRRVTSINENKQYEAAAVSTPAVATNVATAGAAFAASSSAPAGPISAPAQARRVLFFLPGPLGFLGASYLLAAYL